MLLCNLIVPYSILSLAFCTLCRYSVCFVFIVVDIGYSILLPPSGEIEALILWGFSWSMAIAVSCFYMRNLLIQSDRTRDLRGWAWGLSVHLVSGQAKHRLISQMQGKFQQKPACLTCWCCSSWKTTFKFLKKLALHGFHKIWTGISDLMYWMLKGFIISFFQHRDHFIWLE